MLSITSPDAVMTKDKQPQGRWEVALLALGIDAANQIRQRLALGLGDIFQTLPERVLKADARLMSSKDDRAFHNGLISLPLSSSSGRVS
jgi:hypothetical protein